MCSFVYGKVSTAAVAERSPENIIPDGAERLEAEVQQSAAQIQVNFHRISIGKADAQISDCGIYP